MRRKDTGKDNNMKLYGSIASPFVARAVLTARFKGLDLALSDAPGGGIKSPEYLAINPLGKMPALSHDGRHIAESQVICEYLDDVGRGPALMPRDAMDRAQVRLLCRLTDLYLLKDVGSFFRNMNPATRNAAELEAARDGYTKALAHIEHFMGVGPYALAGEVTIADCVLYPSFVMMNGILPICGIPDPFADKPILARWWQMMSAHPVASLVGKQQTEAFMAFMNARKP
jgi:glutathione S-transferase